MIILLKQQGKPIMKLDVEPPEIIENLKAKIHDKDQAINMSNFYLVFKGKTLEDSYNGRTLSDCGFLNGSIFYLAYRYCKT